MTNQIKVSEKIQTKQFDEVKTSLIGGKVGYLAKDVDGFLQEIIMDAETLEKEKRDVERKLELMQTSKNFGTGVAYNGNVSEKEKELMRRTKQAEHYENSQKQMLIHAGEVAMKVREDAETEAANTLNEAKKNAELIIIEAHKIEEEITQKKKTFEQEWESKAKEIIADAERKAQSIVASAEQTAKGIEEKYEQVRHNLEGIYSFLGQEIKK